MLTPIPALSQAVGLPRTAAIEYPLGRTLGKPGDPEGQREVLRSVFGALESIQTPGEIVHLPFVWDAEPNDPYGEPPEAPPIARHIMTHPWQLPRLMRREVPNN